MSKNILERPIEQFRLDVTKMGESSLKTLLSGLYQFIQESADKIQQGQLFDLERKQTIIWKEFQRRGILTKERMDEFRSWLYKHKKRVW